MSSLLTAKICALTQGRSGRLAMLRLPRLTSYDGAYGRSSYKASICYVEHAFEIDHRPARTFVETVLDLLSSAV